MWIFLGAIIAIAALAVSLAVSFPIIIWFYLAPNNRFFTFVEEGTAVIIVTAGKFNKALIQWGGHTFDGEWNVIDGEEHHLFGGLRLYGLWPLLDVFIHRLRWNDIHKSEERDGRIDEVRFHDEIFDHVLLRPDVYWTRLQRAETKPPERVPVDAEFVITMRVINPYKVLFVAPVNWIENVMTRLDALLRGFVANQSLDELIDIEGRGEALWKTIGNSDLVQKTIRKDWGIEIEENGIQLRDVNMTREFQEAAAAQRTEEMRAEGERRRIQISYGAIQEFGGLGQLVRTLEAAERSPLAASLSVQAIPGLQQILGGVFGRGAEAITRENLHEMIAELRKPRRGGRRSFRRR